MTQTLRRVFKLLSGSDPDTSVVYKASTAIKGLNVVMGWAAVGEVDKLGAKQFPLLIVDVPQYAEDWDKDTTGTAYRRITVQLSLIVRAEASKNAALYGTDSIMAWYDKVYAVLYSSQSARNLTDSGVPWADEASNPRNLEELVDIDETGRLNARMRRWEIEYRRVEVDY